VVRRWLKYMNEQDKIRGKGATWCGPASVELTGAQYQKCTPKAYNRSRSECQEHKGCIKVHNVEEASVIN